MFPVRRPGCGGENQSTTGAPPVPESAPQTNSKALFSLRAAAAGRSQSIRGRASRDEAYPVAKKCSKESFWQSGRPLICEAWVLKKFPLAAAGVVGGTVHHPPTTPGPPPPLPESAPQISSKALFSLWAAAAFGRSQSIRGRASMDEAYPVANKCNKEPFWQYGGPLI